jgi:hypothetical protein
MAELNIEDEELNFIFNTAIMTIRRSLFKECISDKLKTSVNTFMNFFKDIPSFFKTNKKEIDDQIMAAQTFFFNKTQKIAALQNKKTALENDEIFFKKLYSFVDSLNKALYQISGFFTVTINDVNNNNIFIDTLFSECSEYEPFNMDKFEKDVNCIIDKINIKFKEASTQIKDKFKDLQIKDIVPCTSEEIKSLWENYKVLQFIDNPTQPDSNSSIKAHLKSYVKIDMYATLLALLLLKKHDLTNFIKPPLNNTDFIDYIFTQFFKMVRESKDTGITKTYSVFEYNNSDTFERPLYEQPIIKFYMNYKVFLPLISKLTVSEKQKILINFFEMNVLVNGGALNDDLIRSITKYFDKNVDTEADLIKAVASSVSASGGKRRKKRTRKHKKRSRWIRTRGRRRL